MARVFQRMVGDREVEVVLDPDTDLKMGKNLYAEAGTVASTTGLVGELIAEAVQEIGTVDAEFKRFRAEMTSRILRANEKIPEWKVKAEVESMPDTLRFRGLLARRDGDLEFLRRYADALRLKATMLRARVDILRAEREAME